jgi:hypothetical protein
MKRNAFFEGYFFAIFLQFVEKNGNAQVWVVNGSDLI